MTIIGRNDSEIGITVTAVSIPVAISSTESVVIDNEFAEYQTWNSAAGYLEWLITTNLDCLVETTNPTTTDISDFPMVKRAGSYPAGGSHAEIVLTRGVCRKSLSLDMQDSG